MTSETTLLSTNVSTTDGDHPRHHPTPEVPICNLTQLAELDVRPRPSCCRANNFAPQASKLILKLTLNPKCPPVDLNSRQFGEVKVDSFIFALELIMFVTFLR